MVKKAPKNGEKGPKSDKKFSGRVRAGSNLLFSGPGRVRATAKSQGPVRAGVDHRPLVLTGPFYCKHVKLQLACTFSRDCSVTPRFISDRAEEVRMAR